MKSHYICIICLSAMLAAGLSSCKKYLDKKPDNSLAIPQTLTDCQYLLDDYNKMNTGYPWNGEAAADNYYITDNDYNIIPVEDRKNYTWAPDAQQGMNWVNPYKTLYNANLVLQVLGKLPNTGSEYNRIKGTALFFRAFCFYQLAQLFARPYDPITSMTDLGLPLRISPDLDVKYNRSTVQETYDRIIQDFTEALTLLPEVTSIQTRPNKTAAYAALARTYLAMGDYTNAGKMADQALALYNTLMDYKTISSIPRFNPEVIFQAVSGGSGLIAPLAPSFCKVDQTLYLSYSANDKRKTLFFRPNTGASAGTFTFRGSYNGLVNAILFVGFATDELFLIRAEAYARSGNTQEAMNDLNALLSKRWDPNATVPAAPYVDQVAANAGDALDKVLIERRKELIFRTLRWTDLRRLNKELGRASTLTRPKNTIPYTPLSPNDLRYILLIPITEEINLSGITQNPR